MRLLLVDWKKDEELSELFSEKISEKLEKEKGFMALAEDDHGRIVGAAAFTVTSQVQGEILQITVVEEFRQTGIGTDLLNFVTDVLKKEGISQLICGRYGTLKEIAFDYAFLTSQGFDVLTDAIHRVSYTMGMILESAALSPLFEKNIPEARNYHELTQQQMNLFNNRLADDGRGIENVIFNRELSVFYVENREITSCMLFSDEAEKQLVNVSNYWQKGNGDPYMLPGMLVGFAKTAKEEYPEDTKVNLRMDGRTVYEAYLKIIGTPIQDRIVQWYRKMI
ncbi:MAG: GNAT family N-acetyltransferase [Butyrivibrio sp.]|nr:GNAT family N-acetyltransferase [Butyrivibrio sp.]